MNLKKKQNLIIIIAIIVIVSTFSISNYLNKQKVYILSQDSQKDASDESHNIRAEIYNESNTMEMNTEKIVVHIEGNVVSPGVYELNENTRVFDAIEAAGGLLETADRRKINLAKKIEDEEYIYIPDINDRDVGVENSIPMSTTINHSKNTSLVNINTASSEELTVLPGIGEVIANRIIEYRMANGAFKATEDLKNVTGIGNKKFDDIKDKITVR